MIHLDFLGDQVGRPHGEPADGPDPADTRGPRPLGFREAIRVPFRRRLGLDEQVAARLGGISGQHRDDAHQVRDQRRERQLLDRQVEHDRGRIGRRERARRVLKLLERDPGPARHLRHVHLGQRLLEYLEIARVALDELGTGQALGGGDGGRDAEQQVGIAAGLRLQVAIRLARGLGLARVDHPELSVRVLG